MACWSGSMHQCHVDVYRSNTVMKRCWTSSLLFILLHYL